MATSSDTATEGMRGGVVAQVERRRARRIEAGALGLLLTTTAGTSYALWRGTQLLQALREAQFEFARHLADDDPATYPRFVEAVRADWPARMAAHAPALDAAVRVALTVTIGFCVFAALRERPVGDDLGAGGGETRRRSLARARAISGFRGRLLSRPPGYASAIATRDAVYIPSEVCQDIDQKRGKDAGERLAFVIVHERAHAESLDNAIWSLGSVNALLVTGLLSVLLVPASVPAAVILLPDSLVRAWPLGASAGLAAVMTALAVAAVGSTSTGLLTSITAAREYSADAIAAAVVGAEHLPYGEGRPGTGLEPWRPGVAVPDRRLHVEGAFPRRGALEALAVGTWTAARSGLAIATGAAYGPAMAAFDAAFLASLATILASVPRAAAGANSHPALPIANLLAVVAAVWATMASIDVFAVGKGLSPIFGARWQFAMVAPPCAVMLALAAIDRPGRRRIGASPPIGVPRRRETMVDLGLFAASVPSWGISYVTGGLCAFAMAGTAADALLGAPVSSATRVTDLASVAACLPLSLLVAKNMRSPTRATAIAEAALAVPVAAATFYVGMVLYRAAAGTPPDGAGSGDLRARLASLDVEALPSPTMAVAFAAIVTASWFARRRSGRPSKRSGARR